MIQLRWISWICEKENIYWDIETSILGIVSEFTDSFTTWNVNWTIFLSHGWDRERARWSESCVLIGFPRWSFKKKLSFRPQNKSFIYQWKPFRSRWLNIGLVLFLRFRWNIQPSWPHAWSIMHMLWFNFIPGSNFLFFCFKLIIMLLSYITIPKNKRKENLNQG